MRVVGSISRSGSIAFLLLLAACGDSNTKTAPLDSSTGSDVGSGSDSGTTTDATSSTTTDAGDDSSVGTDAADSALTDSALSEVATEGGADSSDDSSDAGGDAAVTEASADATEAGDATATEASLDATEAGADASETGASDASDVGSETGGCPGGICDPRDPATRCKSDGTPLSPIVAPTGTVWASSVVAYSSQYGTIDWAATHATGAPDVYPSYGDDKRAWATKNPDDPNEYITLAYPASTHGSAILIYETYAPDAVSKVTITTASGDHVVYTNPACTALTSSPVSCSYVLSIATGTTDAITQIRIDLASEKVPDWNEIDAVGIAP